MPLLSVIIPCHNEINNIEKILKKVRDEKTDKEIIIVDDGSSDGSTEIIRSLEKEGVKALYLADCRGKGYAVRQGIAAATGEYLIIQDADFEYEPEEYGKLLEVLQSGKADCVYGNRFAKGRPDGSMLTAYLGNRFVTLLADRLFRMKLTDMQSCYKMYKTKDIQSFALKENGFTIDIEITYNAAVRKLKMAEVPIAYHPRGYAEGKKLNHKDFFEAVGFIIQKNGESRKREK